MNEITQNEIQLLTDLKEKATRIYNCLAATYCKGTTDDGEELLTDLFDLRDDLHDLVDWFFHNREKPKHSRVKDVYAPLFSRTRALSKQLNEVLEHDDFVPLWLVHNLIMETTRWNGQMDLHTNVVLAELLKDKEPANA